MLKQHETGIEELWDELMDVCNKPLSEVDASECIEFVEKHKPFLRTVEVDVKDAKRRVSLAKGPRAKAPRQEEEKDEPDSGSADDADSGGE